MPNINDYLDWRGDILINEQYKLNEIDSMILARFSYLLFDKIEMLEEQTIQDISNKMKNFKNEEFRFNGDKKLITKLGESSRFKNLKVTDFVENNDKEIEKQFGAITIHLPNDEIYVSYIGTDSTLFGWKEDFNMAFMETVPCQIEGEKYLKNVAEKYTNCKILIGGHSKGGNVAIYSALKTDKDIQDRIKKVYNYDGPGFSKEFINEIENKNIIEKIETYIPQDSIIGRLMEHKEKCEVVKSIEKGIMQHDIYSWQVIRDDMVKMESVTNTSEILNETLQEWLRNTTKEQRRIFIDSIFELIYSTNANTFKEISKNKTANAVTILKKYQEMNEQDKKVMMAMVKVFVKSYFDNIGKQYLTRNESKEGDF